MLGQLPALALLFILIFGLNLIPAFAPPTWMALALVGFEFPGTGAIHLAVVGAVAATLGRLTLARLSHWLLRERLLSDAHRANIDVIKDRLEKRTALTVGLFLFYAFSPLPSNFLFIAYGLTGLPLPRVALPFFIGRLASYTFFIAGGRRGGQAVPHRLPRVGPVRGRLVHRHPGASPGGTLRLHAHRLDGLVRPAQARVDAQGGTDLWMIGARRGPHLNLDRTRGGAGFSASPQAAASPPARLPASSRQSSSPHRA